MAALFGLGPKAKSSQKNQDVERKYVTVFAQSKADVDVSFRDDLLLKPADRYVVGIDTLVATINGFGMAFDNNPKNNDEFIGPPLTQRIGVIMEVLRHHRHGLDKVHAFRARDEQKAATDDVNAGLGDDANLKAAQTYNAGFAVTNTKAIHSFDELFSMLRSLANAVDNELMQTQGINPDLDFNYGATAANGTAGTPDNPGRKHLEFNIDGSGHLLIGGTEAFWHNYYIHVPNVAYRAIFFNDKNQAYLAVDYDNGTLIDPYSHFGDPAAYHTDKFPAKAANYWEPAPNGGGHVNGGTGFAVQCNGNVLSTFDRRVCLEVGTSLPMKSSPLVENEKETADFVLGRFFFKPSIKVDSFTKAAQTEASGVVEFHGPRDRVIYHQLKPQQKINQLRLKLYGRVRVYNDDTEQFEMRTIVLPTAATDWWHCRLHFDNKH